MSDADYPRFALSELRTVAALYVDPNGVYAGLEGVEVWDEARDARRYAGPWPVVAHPPCNKWGQLVRINTRRLPNYFLGDDGGCFEAALKAVRTWGGVLEHPAHTYAWPAFGLPKPGTRGGWQQSFDDVGWVAQVTQATYGHEATKDTWLYYVGDNPPPALDWRYTKGAKRISGFDQASLNRKPTLCHGKSAYTPRAFADVLLSMARTASKVAA